MNAIADPRRRRAEDAAIRAEQAIAAGDETGAAAFFAESAEIEETVAVEVPVTSPRVRSILAISATSLWLKAQQYERAKRVAYRFLAGEGLTDGSRLELEALVDASTQEAALAGHATGMIPVELKMEGGHVGVGIAPASVAAKRREAALMLLRRSAEYEAQLAYRPRGSSALELQDHIELFETTARAASYGLRFYVATGVQLKTAPHQLVTPKKVVERFLGVAALAADGPGAIEAAINDPSYARAFIAGFADIAPDGDDVRTVRCSAPSWRVPNLAPLTFEARHRAPLKRAADVSIPKPTIVGTKILEGAFRVVLQSGDVWIELQVGASEPHIVMVYDAKVRASLARQMAKPKGHGRAAPIRMWVKRSERAKRDVLAKFEILDSGKTT